MPVAASDASQVRRLRFPAGTRFANYGDYQRHYMDGSGWLIPNTEVWFGDELWMKINALGCKGHDLRLELGVIGFFGDSTTMGIGPTDGWPFHVRLPGYQSLNAGVEGHAFDRLCTRYARVKPLVDFSAVVIGGTWHNIVYNERGEEAWSAFFSRFGTARVLALCTLPTALIPEACERGLNDLLGDRPGRRPFCSWGSWPTDAAGTRELYEAALRYNAFVRRYCRHTGAVLIDLFSVYRPPSYGDIPVLFWDPVHARPGLYPSLGKCVRTALAPYLPAQREHGTTSTEEPLTAAAGAQELCHKVYPLW